MATTYSFLDVVATLTDTNGNSISLGYGAGVASEGLTIEMLADKDILTIGADSTPMHSLVASNAASILVRLLKTSPVNNQLSVMYNTQKNNPAVWGQNVLSVRDILQGDVLTAEAVAFSRQPTVNYHESAGNQEWRFLCGTLTELLGPGVPDLSAIV